MTEATSVPSRPKGTSLSRIVAEIEAAFETHDHALTAALIERNLLAAWFGINPYRFGEILSSVLRSGTPVDPVIQVLEGVLFGELDEGVFEEAAGDAAPGMSVHHEVGPGGAMGDVETAEFGELPAANLQAVGQMFKLRMAGRMTEALASVTELRAHREMLQSVFDKNQGWSLFTTVQLGITQMLAGDFRGALVSFAHARMHGIVPSLEFLSRDACVKAALIEAFYGDAEKARSLLDEADRVPRTESWTELELDTAYTTVSALVSADSNDEARRMLEAVSMSDVGEGWPFYLAAVQRILLADGDHTEVMLRLETYQQMPLPHVVGDGYSGSALSLSAAVAALARGDLGEAREYVARCDASMVPTRLLLAALHLVAGDPRSGLLAALELRECTQGLRLLEVWRIIVVTSSHLALGEQEECAAVLARATGAPFKLRAAEAEFFPAEVQAFASSQLAAWPGNSEDRNARAFTIFELGREPLTEREVEALKLLAGGLSREQIASRMFVSINTLKGYLRSLYRKLGVKSRNEALAEGEARGLL